MTICWSTLIRPWEESEKYNNFYAVINNMGCSFGASRYARRPEAHHSPYFKDNDAPGMNGPLAQLDVLYGRILSKIPEKVMVNTRKLLLLSMGSDWSGESLRTQCNLLGFTEDAAYGAIRHLYSVVKISDPEKADEGPIEFIHKSFNDYLYDFERSGFAKYVYSDPRELASQLSLRIAKEVPTSEAKPDEVMLCGATGSLKGNPGICNTISLSWPGDERFVMTDEELGLKLYTDAMNHLSSNFRDLQNMFTFELLTTRFASAGYLFPFDELRSFAFGGLRSELSEAGKFKLVPLQALDYAAIWGEIDFQFISPTEKDVPLSNPWNTSCRHQNWAVNDSQQIRQSASFFRYGVGTSSWQPEDIPRFSVASISKTHSKCFSFYTSDFVRCSYCLQRLARYFINNAGEVVTIFIDFTEMCYVELSFVDPDDGVSEWRYQFLHSGLPTGIAAQ